MMREAKPVVGLLLSTFAWQASLAAGQVSDQAVLQNDNLGGGQRPCGCGSTSHTDAAHYGGSGGSGSYEYHWEKRVGGGADVGSGSWDSASQGSQGGGPRNGGSHLWHWESPGGQDGAPSGGGPGTSGGGSGAWGGSGSGDTSGPGPRKWDGSRPGGGASGSGSGKCGCSGPG
ncbi:hypothetical protein ETB97_010415, partial [Aspergillus alliaceus]